MSTHKRYNIYKIFHLNNSHVETFDGIAKLMSMVLGAVIIVLVIVVIGLFVKFRKHHTGMYYDLICKKYQQHYLNS